MDFLIRVKKCKREKGLRLVLKNTVLTSDSLKNFCKNNLRDKIRIKLFDSIIIYCIIYK